MKSYKSLVENILNEGSDNILKEDNDDIKQFERAINNMKKEFNSLFGEWKKALKKAKSGKFDVEKTLFGISAGEFRDLEKTLGVPRNQRFES